MVGDSLNASAPVASADSGSANVSAVDTEGGWQPAKWPLPRVSAVDNLAAALSSRGFTDGVIRVLSHAAVRPDELRRKLADPAELRVQGGTLLIAETRLWSAAVVPHPANPREYGRRSYALGGAAANLRVLPEPTTSRDGLAELEILVDSPSTLAQRLEDAQGRLAKENPLGEDVAVDGVLQPLTVVPMTVRHRDGYRSAPLLIAADGSSRISAVHDLLDYAPSKVAYEWSSDSRRGERLYEVDEKGARVFSSGGEPRELTDALVRHAYNGESTTGFPPAAGFTAASRHWADVRAKVEELTKAVEAMAVVPVDEGGRSLVERDGWDDAQIAELRWRLDRSDRKLAAWADTYDFNRQAAQEQADEDQAS